MPEARVALIEAGGARLELATKVPGTAFIASTSARRNWNFETEPVPALNGRKLSWFQGRILGGSGSINGMLYLRSAGAARLAPVSLIHPISSASVLRTARENTRGRRETIRERKLDRSAR
jgi:hypothetical protein